LKRLFKRNQLMITALAIMLAIAGYLQFAGTNPADEDRAANSNHLVSEMEGTITEVFTVEDTLFSDISSDIVSLDTDVDSYAENYLDTGMTTAEVQSGEGTSLAEGENSSDEGNISVAEAQPKEGEVPGEAIFTSAAGLAVLSDAKLAKEQVRSKNKETLMEIINSTGITDFQKQSAVDAMVEMTGVAEKEAAAEMLLQAKGFHDVIVSINGGAVDVVVNTLELTDAQRAQIEDIVKRKTDIGAENIIISTVVE